MSLEVLEASRGLSPLLAPKNPGRWAL